MKEMGVDFLPSQPDSQITEGGHWIETMNVATMNVRKRQDRLGASVSTTFLRTILAVPRTERLVSVFRELPAMELKTFEVYASG